jgi:hypothetical protein
MRGQGELTMAQIARTLNVGRSTLYEHLGELPTLDGSRRKPRPYTQPRTEEHPAARTRSLQHADA